MVDDNLKSWHAGLGNFSPSSKLQHRADISMENNLNSYSLGIEIENSGNESYTSKQIESVTKLVSHLAIKYHVPPLHIVGHNVWTPNRKMDPGPYFYEIRESLCSAKNSFSLTRHIFP